MSKNKEASKREHLKLAGQMDYLMIAGLIVTANIVSDAEMLNQYIKLYIQAGENRCSLREIKFPYCDKTKL
ncbi:hypothetical protein OA58_24595, partial [Microcystis aeruginosa NIES-88]|uniref:hypothetical protein n=1 Tax=Microcystis aeruginosa TaxID=1126 RepID=UPI00079BDF76